MEKPQILITWWLGYIGSHGVVAFYEAGYIPVIVDNLSNTNEEVLDNIEKIISYRPDFYNVDLRDKTKLQEIFQIHNFDGVVHFAWLKSVGESCDKALEYFDNNIVGSLRLFECMEEFNVRNIIFSSSATVYSPENFENANNEPVSESGLAWNTTNPYGTSKYLLEKILYDLAKFSNFNVMNLRYFNPIWAHPSWLIWEAPQGIPNNLLPYIFKVVTGDFEYLRVFGDDYNTSDWTGVRDYIDVCDLINGHLKAFHLLDSNELNTWFFRSVNLWTWIWSSVLEMLQLVSEVTDLPLKHVVFPRRPWDLDSVYCNPSLAFELLWWKSETSLRESLENSWKFYKGR